MASGWIRPFALFDNFNGRGVWCVPKLQANVAVMFIQGQDLHPEFARYIVDCWGRPFATSGIPSETESGSPDIVVMAFDGFAIVVDERVGQQKATLIDRTNGSYFRFDVANKDLLISAARDFKRTVVRNEEASITGDWKITVTGNVDIQATGDAKVKASGNALLEGATGVKIGESAVDAVALKIGLKAWLEGHTHNVPGVMSGPATALASPSTMPVPDAMFTTKTKME